VRLRQKTKTQTHRREIDTHLHQLNIGLPGPVEPEGGRRKKKEERRNRCSTSDHQFLSSFSLQFTLKITKYLNISAHRNDINYQTMKQKDIIDRCLAWHKSPPRLVSQSVKRSVKRSVSCAVRPTIAHFLDQRERVRNRVAAVWLRSAEPEICHEKREKYRHSRMALNPPRQFVIHSQPIIDH
jgi:hypothetical protein